MRNLDKHGRTIVVALTSCLTCIGMALVAIIGSTCATPAVAGDDWPPGPSTPIFSMLLG